LGEALAGVWGTEVQEQSPGGGLGAKLPEARRMLRHEADENHLRREKTSPYRLTLYDNIIISHLIHSSFSVSSHFCRKIQNTNNFWL